MLRLLYFARGSRLLIWILCCAGACSTYSRDLYQKPVPGAEVTRREAHDPLLRVPVEQAVYTTPAFQLTAWVPISGTNRVAFGPCLLPLIPGRKEFPRSLEVVVMIAPAEKASGVLTVEPGEWRAVLGQSEDLGGLEADTPVRAYSILSRPAADRDPLGGNDVVILDGGGAAKNGVQLSTATRLRLLFGEYDNRFDGFVLKNIRVKLAGRNYEVPEIAFARKSRGRYTPFTTKVLDL